MKNAASLNSVYAPSDEVVAREIQGEFIVIPIVSGVGDLEDEIFSLNKTARAIWIRLDGKKNLKKIVDELASEFKATAAEIKTDALGLIKELLKRRMLVEIKKK